VSIIKSVGETNWKINIVCPKCGYVCTAMSGVNHDKAPEPGDYNVCLRCAAPMVLGEGMKPALVDLSTLTGDLRDTLEAAVYLIKSQRHHVVRTVHLHAKWFGEPPKPGEFLRSEKRPRHAYRIREVTPRGMSSDVPIDLYGEPTQRIDLQCEVVDLADVPTDAIVHPWKWDSRDKKGVVWRT
jgi:hypothetical protein